MNTEYRSKLGARLDMVSFRSRRGEAGAGTLPLMILAFVVAAGFFTWLYFQAAPVEVVVVEGDGPVVESMAAVVDIADFGMNPMAVPPPVVAVWLAADAKGAISSCIKRLVYF